MLHVIAAASGVDMEKLTADHSDQQHYGDLTPTSGPSIADLAARIQPPPAGGETLDASREIFRILDQEHANGG